MRLPVVGLENPPNSWKLRPSIEGIGIATSGTGVNGVGKKKGLRPSIEGIGIATKISADVLCCQAKAVTTFY